MIRPSDVAVQVSAVAPSLHPHRRRAVGATVSRLVSIAGTTVASGVLIGLLPADELGRYFTAMTYGYIANAALGVALDQRVQRLYLPMLKVGSFPGRHLAAVVAAYACIGLAIALAAAPWIGLPAVPMLTLLTLATFIAASSRSLNIILDGQATLNRMVVVEGVLKPAMLAGALLFSSRPSHVSAIVAYAAVTGLVALWGLRRIAVQTHPIVISNPLLGTRSSLAFMLPIGAGALLNLAQLQGYRIYFSDAGALVEVGLYAAIAGLGASLTQALGAVYNQMAQRRLFDDADPSAMPRYFRHAALLLAGCAVAVALASPVFLALFRPAYLGLWYLALFGVVVEGGNLLLGAAGLHLSVARSRPRLILIFSLAGLVVTAVGLGLASADAKPWQFGASLAAGQLAAVALAWACIRRTSEGQGGSPC